MLYTWLNSTELASCSSTIRPEDMAMMAPVSSLSTSLVSRVMMGVVVRPPMEPRPVARYINQPWGWAGGALWANLIDYPQV